MKTTSLNYDGWHSAQVWACYLPKRAPGDPVTWRVVCCLDPAEGLSPGQGEEIDRVYAAYPHLNDDAFVAAHRERWLTPDLGK